MNTIRVYVWSENCIKAGRVATPAEVERLTDSDGVVSLDLWLFGEGTKADILEQAKAESGRSDYRGRCARAVVDALN